VRPALYPPLHFGVPLMAQALLRVMQRTESPGLVAGAAVTSDPRSCGAGSCLATGQLPATAGSTNPASQEH
jgi:hypothetical protein